MSLPAISVLADGSIVIGWQGINPTAGLLQLGPEPTGNQVLHGTAGSDYLYGGAGNDRLYGNGNFDVLFGGSGDDRYYVLPGDRVVEHAGEGMDTVYVLGGNFSLQAGNDVEIIRANAGSSGLALTGNEFSNAIYGGAGDDSLDGGAGADRLVGGGGNDTYYRDNAGDIIVEKAGEGTDTVFASVTTRLSANVENLMLTGSADINGTGNELDNAISGNSGDNVLSGGEGNDILDGGGGADRMIGGLGNDTYYRNNTGEVIVERADEGVDTVFASVTTKLSANVENLTLMGSSAINGTGNGLDNVIVGNSAVNVINGGAGGDTLTGGGGNDVFVFQAGETHGDTITDFDGRGVLAGDRIKLVGFGTAADVMIVERAPPLGMPVGTRAWEVCYGPSLSIHETVYFTNGANLDVQHDLIYL